jgi:pimeloyl-ACP methyl ester carboxylesterase
VNAGQELKNIVLVHGGFVDGSGWQGVYDHLTADGYRVAIVQNPTLSLAGDVAATHLVLDGLDGPAVLVGHSYGGAVITEAGTHPNVAALAYITAFAPDKSESVNSLIAGFPADGGKPCCCRVTRASGRPACLIVPPRSPPTLGSDCCVRPARSSRRASPMPACTSCSTRASTRCPS